jgi:hypothetical protein
VNQADIIATRMYLKELLTRSTTLQGLEWLEEKLETAAAGKNKEFYLAFSAAPRFVGKKKLQFSEVDGQQAQQIRKGFDPSRMSCPEIGLHKSVNFFHNMTKS